MEQFQMDLSGRTLTIETGELAKQAGGAVMVRYGDTAVLVTATGSKEAKDIDFFPLTVDYEEKIRFFTQCLFNLLSDTNASECRWYNLRKSNAANEKGG